MLTQQSYTLDMVQKEDEKVKPKKIPRSRDQAAMEPKEESASIGKVKGSSGAKSSWRSAMANHKSSSRSHVRGLKDGISCDSCS